jgi:hypothetical protein
VDEVVNALGYIVGKKAAAPDGSSVSIELSGPVRRKLNVLVEGRGRVVDTLPRSPTATLRMGSGLFVRLAAGRVDPSSHLGDIQLNGDTELGRRVATNLAFTI